MPLKKHGKVCVNLRGSVWAGLEMCRGRPLTLCVVLQTDPRLTLQGSSGPSSPEDTSGKRVRHPRPCRQCSVWPRSLWKSRGREVSDPDFYLRDLPTHSTSSHKCFTLEILPASFALLNRAKLPRSGAGQCVRAWCLPAPQVHIPQWCASSNLHQATKETSVTNCNWKER